MESHRIAAISSLDRIWAWCTVASRCCAPSRRRSFPPPRMSCHPKRRNAAVFPARVRQGIVLCVRCGIDRVPFRKEDRSACLRGRALRRVRCMACACDRSFVLTDSFRTAHRSCAQCLPIQSTPASCDGHIPDQRLCSFDVFALGWQMAMFPVGAGHAELRGNRRHEGGDRLHRR